DDSERPVVAKLWQESLPALPAVLCAALALFLGIFPQALFGIGANLAAGDLLQASAFPHNVTVQPTGIITPTGQWKASIAWSIVLVLLILFALLRLLRPRAAGSGMVQETNEVAVGQDELATEELEESPSLVAPTETWDQLRPAFSSEWLQPGAFLLLDGTDDELDADESEEGAEGAPEAEEATAPEHEGDEHEPESAEQDGAGTAPRSKPAKRL